MKQCDTQPRSERMHVSRSTLASLLAPLPSWVPTAVIIVSVLITSLIYLWPTPVQFPMDDTYIHFVYAQNLAEQGRLMFNFASEKGVGTTSALWVLLLAAGHALGVPMHALAKVLGMSALSTVGVGLYLLLRPIWRRLPALVGALLVALSGNLVWFALSGMETVLFVALGVLALLYYRDEHWGRLGLVLGLLTLTRPEGLVLMAAVGCVELWRHRGIQRGILVTGLICAMVCGPWFGYLLWRTGRLLPTSAVGKMFSFDVALNFVSSRSESLAVLSRFSPLVYTAMWVPCFLEFTLGGMALPPPCISIVSDIGNPGYTVSLWAVIGWIGVITPLMFVAGRRVGSLRRWRNWVQDRARRPMVCFLIWVGLHNLTYALFVPVPGTACRYGAINYVALWLALTMGLLSFADHTRLRIWLAGGLAILAISNTAYWNSVYDANLEHMLGVRIAAAHFVRDDLPAGELCAASDIGALRYHSQSPIVDLGGLVDPDSSKWFVEGICDRYIVENDATCLVLPGRVGARDEGFFDIANILGLTTSPLFEMHQIAVFEIDRARWLHGYLPTTNYQATVAIYHLEMASDPAAIRDAPLEE